MHRTPLFQTKSTHLDLTQKPMVFPILPEKDPIFEEQPIWVK